MSEARHAEPRHQHPYGWGVSTHGGLGGAKLIASGLASIISARVFTRIEVLRLLRGLPADRLRFGDGLRCADHPTGLILGR